MTEWAPCVTIHLVTDPDGLFAERSILLGRRSEEGGKPFTPDADIVPLQDRWKL